MKVNLISAVLMAASFSLPAAASPTSCDNVAGNWKNNLGATISFDTVDETTGQIVGRYFPSSMPERAFPLTGFTNAGGKTEGEQHYAVSVSFAVSFQEFGGITSWTGICRMEDELPLIETEDLIVAPMADYVWSHVIANHDTLRPQ